MSLDLGQPYIRHVEVLIGPLAEWKGGGNSKQAVRIFGDGSNSNMRIKFSVKKHIISTASPTIISLYNLSPALRNNLKKSNARVVLNAGWSNTGMVPVFSGSLLAVVNEREGADIITKIISLSGFGGTSRAVVSKAFAGGAKLKSMIANVAKEIPGVTVDTKNIDIQDLSIGNQGWSHAGMATEWLDRLARVYGFSWWINDGVFYAVGDKKALSGGEVLLSSANGFLSRIEPMLASPMQIQAGVSINSLFNPYLQPGKSVRVDSAINPKLNGSYKIHTLSHTGDTHSTQWTSSIESWLVM